MASPKSLWKNRLKVDTKWRDHRICRGRRLRRPAAGSFVHKQDHVDVVGHDYKFVYMDTGDIVTR